MQRSPQFLLEKVVMLPWTLALFLLAATCFSSARGQSSDYPLCDSGFEDLVGNGGCSDINNTEECGWDGGDCCECDCEDGTWECGVLGYDCRDPDSTCYEGPTTDDFYDSSDDFYDSSDDFYGDDDYPLCDGYVPGIASGACTGDNNNAECGWDGGDCCECDCIPDFMDCGSQGYDCQDTSSDCYEGESAVSDVDGDSGDTTDFAEDSENYWVGVITVCVIAGVILLILTCVLFRADSFVTCTCCCLSERAAAGKAPRASPSRHAAPLSPPPPYGSSPRGTSAVGTEYAAAAAPSASSRPPRPADPVSPPPAYGAPHATIEAPRAPTAPPAP